MSIRPLVLRALAALALALASASSGAAAAVGPVHCTFTPAETLAALGALIHRVETHRWPDLSPQTLNGAAAALGPGFNFQLDPNRVAVPTPPAFLTFKPTAFPRPFSLEDRGQRVN